MMIRYHHLDTKKFQMRKAKTIFDNRNLQRMQILYKSKKSSDCGDQFTWKVSETQTYRVNKVLNMKFQLLSAIVLCICVGQVSY